MTKYEELLQHPYSRYGFAIAVVENQVGIEDVTPTELISALISSIETGLGHFRFETQDNPDTSRLIRYNYIKFVDLKKEPALVQSKGLASKGKFLAPNIVAVDKKAKGAYLGATKVIEGLQQEKVNLFSSYTYARSFAPTTAKINNKIKTQRAPVGTLLEAACAVITTLTPHKPSAWAKKQNTEKRTYLNYAIIPALGLEEMIDFVELFIRIESDELTRELYQAEIQTKRNKAKEDDAIEEADEESEEEVSKYPKPAIIYGNYPYAPRAFAFSAIGLLAAIGKWAYRAGNVPWAKRVLESIAGTSEKPGVPLYIISYDSISQVQFTHHVIGLSIEGKLSELIDALIYRTTILAELENTKPKYKISAYKLFYLMTSRFLQLFNESAFCDFLATRAEYAPEVSPMFEEYFMKTKTIPKDVVESARAFGQWLNSTAYFVAKGEVGQSNDYAKINKAKAKILVEFESAAMSAENAQDMLHRISTRAGRLLQQDAPADVVRFMDAANSGEIEAQDALHLLVSYLRIRTQKETPNGGQHDN
jgi:hypothetical protein